MKVIGLCGGSGSGKGTLAAMLSEAGLLHIDADAIYHGITSTDTPCLRELCSEFGSGILSPDGSLDRRALSEIVFADGGKDKLLRLNSIAHRYVLDEMRRLIADADEKYLAALVDAPLLFESGFNTECDLVISVIAPREERISRICERDGLSRESAERRINSQIDDEFLRAHSDIIINNDKDAAALRAQADEIINRLKENCYGR